VKKPWTYIVPLLLAVTVLSFIVVQVMPGEEIDFSTQVKPILNENCLSCHGGVKQSGGFGIVFRENALAPTESGKPAIIPGDPSNSEMIKRLTSKDPEARMPYKKDPLSKEEIRILEKWVAQGAQWDQHWAYEPVEQIPVPAYRDQQTGFNHIDVFIEEKRKKLKLLGSPEADKPTLMRRVSLDLIGLPPPGSLAEQFLNDHSENAYEHLVDGLLASPRFGERWTALWLDLARYADTKGYERDDSRNIWRYRDWLIRAFNDD